MTSRHRARWRRPRPAVADGGSAAIELVAGVGLLVLPTVLLVLSLPGWAQARTAADVAAREAARTVVLADDPTGAEALEAGRRVAGSVLANHGHTGRSVPEFTWEQIEVTGQEGRVRQQLVRVTVHVRMPAVSVPLIGSWAGFDWSVTHVEPVDIYRSVP